MSYQKYGTDDVTDPKDLFTTSLPKWQTVKNNMSDIISELEAKTFRDGDIRELTTALIFPILLVEASIVEMENIVKTADKIEKEKKKEFIMLWVQVSTQRPMWPTNPVGRYHATNRDTNRSCRCLFLSSALRFRLQPE